MYRVSEAVRQADLARLLKDIQLWLEHNGCDSGLLITKKETFDIVIVELLLSDRCLAEGFVRDFQGWALFPAMIS
jgi:hypothetical protein